jgi:hypothetical protein
MNNIKAIETIYKGYRFRSRLEARWAVFFDALEIDWEYEKEGYVLPPRPFDARQVSGVLDDPANYSQEEIDSARRHWERDEGILGTLHYLPDFWLPEQQAWVEIKGADSTGEEQHKCKRLAAQADANVFLFDTGLEFDQDSEVVPHAWGYMAGTGAILSAGYSWCECPICHKCNIYQVDPDTGNGSMMHIRCLSSYVYGFARGVQPPNIFDHMDTTPHLMNAYTAARQARFEHGEKPRR